MKRASGMLGLALLSLAAGCGDAGAGAGAPAALLADAPVAQAATDQLAVTGLQKTAETRVGRTVFEYTFKVTLKNNGSAAVSGATAQLTGAPAGTSIVDGKVAAGAIAAGASVTPDDSIVLRVDRATPFDSAALAWQLSTAAAASAWTGVRQDVTPYPSNASTGVNNNTGKGTALATDAEGNVVVAGAATGGFADVPNPEQSSGAFVARYSPAGQLLWGRRILDQGNIFGVEESAYGVGVDKAGNIYVTGQTLNALPGEIAAGNLDVFIAKFDKGGNRLWAHQFGSNQLDSVRGLAVDANGNAVIVGYTFGQLPLQPPPNGQDFFIAKYDSAGNRVLLSTYDLGRTEDATGVALDTAGNIYVAGTTAQQAGDFAGTKGYAAKFNGSGVQQWLTLIGETAFPLVQPNAIAVAADGATVYLAGRTYQDFDAAGQPQVAPGCCVQGDAFVARLSGSSGARSWIHNLSSQTLSGDRRFDDGALGLATDATGSAAYLTGYTAGVMPGETSKGADDLFVARYGNDGTRSWVRQLGSGLPAGAAQLDRGFGIALDPAGDLFVTGSTVGTFGTAPRNIDRPNWFVLKMKPVDGSLY